MNKMFLGATSFNQPLNNWNVSKVKNMSDMFAGATSLTDGGVSLTVRPSSVRRTLVIFQYFFGAR